MITRRKALQSILSSIVAVPVLGAIQPTVVADEMCVSGDTLVITSQGVTEIEKLSASIKELEEIRESFRILTAQVDEFESKYDWSQTWLKHSV